MLLLFLFSRISGSVLVGVNAGLVECDGAILINVTAKSVRAAPGSIVYNVVDESEAGLDLAAGQVMAGVFGVSESGSGARLEVLHSHLNIDGG